MGQTNYVLSEALSYHVVVFHCPDFIQEVHFWIVKNKTSIKRWRQRPDVISSWAPPFLMKHCNNRQSIPITKQSQHFGLKIRRHVPSENRIGALNTEWHLLYEICSVKKEQCLKPNNPRKGFAEFYMYVRKINEWHNIKVIIKINHILCKIPIR
jgi:hypothetical protein